MCLKDSKQLIILTLNTFPLSFFKKRQINYNSELIRYSVFQNIPVLIVPDELGVIIKVFYLHIHLSFLNFSLHFNTCRNVIPSSYCLAFELGRRKDKDGITNATGPQASDILIYVLLSCIGDTRT